MIPFRRTRGPVDAALSLRAPGAYSFWMRDRNRPGVLLPLLPLLLLVLAAPRLEAQSVVYLVRHAEKADLGDDPGLTDAGRARAETLARILADEPLTGVLSTDYERTRKTAASVAAVHGVEVEVYDPRDPGPLLRRILGTPGRYLVVGHSNTIPDLVATLGGDPGPPIDDAEYDRLYVVMTLQGSAEQRSRGRNLGALLRFGEPFRRP